MFSTAVVLPSVVCTTCQLCASPNYNEYTARGLNKISSHLHVEAKSGHRAGRVCAVMAYARVSSIAMLTIFGSTISELACSEKSGTGSREVLGEKTSVVSSASSQNASMRKMKATKIDVIDKVSRMFQLSWVKYLDGNGSSVADDGEDAINQKPASDHRRHLQQRTITSELEQQTHRPRHQNLVWSCRQELAHRDICNCP